MSSPCCPQRMKGRCDMIFTPLDEPECDYCDARLAFVALYDGEEPYRLPNGAGQFCSEECAIRWAAENHYGYEHHESIGECLEDGFLMLALDEGEEHED